MPFLIISFTAVKNSALGFHLQAAHFHKTRTKFPGFFSPGIACLKRTINLGSLSINCFLNLLSIPALPSFYFFKAENLSNLPYRKRAIYDLGPQVILTNYGLVNGRNIILNCRAFICK